MWPSSHATKGWLAVSLVDRHWPGIVAGAALLAGYLWGLAQPTAVPVNFFQLPVPQALPSFRLTQSNGEEFNPDSLAGTWSVVFSGFTSCADVCPTTLSLLSQVDADIEPLAGGVGHQLVFLTVDPERDTPAALAQYLGYFSANIIGVTGANDQLDRLLAGLGFYPSAATNQVPSKQVPSKADIAHSGAIAVVDPAARLVGLIRAPFTQGELRQQLAVLLTLPQISVSVANLNVALR